MKVLRHNQEEPLVAVADLLGLDTPARNEELRAKIIRKFEACFNWLAGPPMTQRDWTIWEVRRAETFLFSVTNGLVLHLPQPITADSYPADWQARDSYQPVPSAGAE
jgi:hypothetical protein